MPGSCSTPKSVALASPPPITDMALARLLDCGLVACGDDLPADTLSRALLPPGAGSTLGDQEALLEPRRRTGMRLPRALLDVSNAPGAQIRDQEAPLAPSRRGFFLCLPEGLGSQNYPNFLSPCCRTQGPLMAKAKTQAWLDRVAALYAPEAARRIIES